MSDAVQIVQDWQTLISAIIALLAAAWTVRAMKQQMSQEEDRHSRFAQRKKKAMRSKMPDALSEIHKHVEDVAIAVLVEDPIPSTAPIAALGILQDAIEFIDDGAAERCFELVSFYQVWSARINNPKRRDRMINYKEMGILDSAKLRFLVSSLFAYARNENDEVDLEAIPEDDLASRIRSMIGYDLYDEHQRLLENVVSRRK